MDHGLPVHKHVVVVGLKFELGLLFSMQKVQDVNVLDGASKKDHVDLKGNHKSVSRSLSLILSYMATLFSMIILH